MKRPVEEHAKRFDEKAAEYDDAQDSDEYRACLNLVIEHAAPTDDDVVLDIGTGTGAVALVLADEAETVIGRDISDDMMNRARKKARSNDIDNVSFDSGTFREPNYDGDVDVITTNFAMHHLDDAGKREAIDVCAGYEPKRLVIGDVMLFGDPEPKTPVYDPTVDDPATVGILVDALTDSGFVITAVEQVHEQIGVIVGRFE